MVINSLIFLREFSNKIQKQQIEKVRSPRWQIEEPYVTVQYLEWNSRIEYRE